MLLKDAGSPCYQAKGSPRITNEATKASPHLYPTGAHNATSRAGAGRTTGAFAAGDGALSVRQRIRPARFAVYAYVVAVILWLAGTVAGALIGWHAVALLEGAILWAIVCAWSWDAARRWKGRRP